MRQARTEPVATLRGLPGVLLAGLLALGLLAVPAATAGATEGASTTAGSPLPVTVSVNRIDPQVLTPGEDLTLAVTLTNTGTTPVTEPRVLVDLDRSSFLSRSSLDTWRDAGPYDAAGTTVLQVDLAAPLAVGSSASATLTVPAASVGLPSSSSSWGARGLAVEVVDAADPTRIRLGIMRTFALWFPAQEVTPTTLSILVPFTSPDPSSTAASTIADQTTSGGRLDRLLTATASHPDVTWAVDPSLLATASAGGSATGPAWAEEVVAASEGREVQLLPWGDADTSALAHTGATELSRLAWELSEAEASALGLRSSEVLAWPGAATTDLTTALEVSAGGSRAVVVSPGELLPPSVLTYTPTGLAGATVGTTTVDLLVPDPELSTSLETGMTAEEADAGGAAQLTPATAAADVLAELAIITRERPSDGRHVLATLSRTWSPSADVTDAQLSAIEAAPWVDLVPVSELAAREVPAVDRGTLPQQEIDPDEVSSAELARSAAALDARESIATMGSDPEALVGDVTLERLAVTALAWRTDPDGRAAAIGASQAATAALRSAVSVPPSATVNLLSTSGELPLRVDNALDQDVTLLVRLLPGDSRLVAGSAVEVVVPARGEATVTIPVRGVQSADVEAVVELSTPSGVVVDSSTRLTVRVRAEWENIGTAVIGGLLALGLVIGLVRTARRARGTRADRAAAAGQPEPLASEDQEES
ncbi:DUF6049 family protein [Actinotalea sp.]|uniref:DUF6049 family protein n=1 Tax=Actinotalea sp. TaxID=1872145 RepID=UPI003562EB4D